MDIVDFAFAVVVGWCLANMVVIVWLWVSDRRSKRRLQRDLSVTREELWPGIKVWWARQ